MSGKDHLDHFYKEQQKFDAKKDKWRRKLKHNQDRKSVDDVFDFSTAKILHKLIKSDFIKEVTGIISTGKEANVYIGLTGSKSIEELERKGLGEDSNREFVAIKVYRTRVIEFKKFQRYLRGDPRFKTMSKSSHKLITEWALKEYKNLVRLNNINIRAPIPVSVKRNVLVTQFIGEGELPAPLLKNVSGIDYQGFYDSIIESIKRIFLEAKLVHADLSEYNLLYYKGSVYFIDVGQAVLDSHPEAIAFLRRDIENINFFFNRKGIEKLYDPVDTIKELLKQKDSDLLLGEE